MLNIKKSQFTKDELAFLGNVNRTVKKPFAEGGTHLVIASRSPHIINIEK